MITERTKEMMTRIDGKESVEIAEHLIQCCLIRNDVRCLQLLVG